MAARKPAEKDTSNEPVTPGLTDEEQEANSLNMGGGGDVVLHRDDVPDPDEEKDYDDVPKGGDGENPVSPNNPPKKALLGDNAQTEASEQFASSLGDDKKK